jgi:poly(3-hydroxybutyrate) depolymerase
VSARVRRAGRASRHAFGQLTKRLGVWLVFGLVALPSGGGVLGCDSPSSRIDGNDLRGVFERSASAVSAQTASPSASAAAHPAAPARRARDAGALPAVPELRRKPISGPCAGTTAPAPPEELPVSSKQRPLGRPGCRAARILEWRDRRGDPRYACLFEPVKLSEHAPVPLLVFFHGELDTPKAVGLKTHLRERGQSFELAGDPAHAGFVLLAPQGRKLGGRLTFDSERVSADNVDAQAVDHFVEQVRAEGMIDPARVYLVGDSLGGRMAALYAMLRPDLVAALVTYGTEASGIEWTCEPSPPPALIVYRACDGVLPCDRVEQWIAAREEHGAPTVGLRLDEGRKVEPACISARRCQGQRSQANHNRWPKERETDMLEFLSRYSLEIAR